MLSTAVAAWRNLVKRLSVDWLILAAGLVTILLAMILLAAGPIYADAVTESALRRTLDISSPADSTVTIEVRTPPDGYDTVDAIATTALTKALAGVEAPITRVIDAQSLRLPVQNAEDTVDLGQLRYMEGIEEHAHLMAGNWPDASEAPVQMAVSATTADQLGIDIGDVMAMVDPRDESRQVELELAGIFQIEDTNDRYWLDDALVLDGPVETRGFRTFGPFIIDEPAISAITPREIATWRALPDFDTLEIDEASGVRGGVASLSGSVNADLAIADESGFRFSEFTVHTELDRLLSGTERSLTVTRSSVLALLLQLAILAGYALALTSGLLVETRSTETALLRARGASPGQVVAVAGLEGLLLTVPAALATPWLAAMTVEALVSFGPLAPIGLDVAPAVIPESRIIVLLAAVAAVVALVWPAWRSARTLSGSSRRRREGARSKTQRAGVDFALVALAALAFWQLTSLGPQVSSTIQGRFGIDPILIAAPTLGLVAGSVLALRVVPFLARLAERVASAGRSVVPALSAWQVARRPLRYARAALLLIMAVAIGFFAASYSSTWLDSQRDQADFQVGADLRVQTGRRLGDSAGDLQLVSAQESIPGVARSMPVTRVRGVLPGSDSPAEFLLLDSSAAAGLVSLREDLAPDFDALMAKLSDARPLLSGLTLPGEPEYARLVIDAVEEEMEDEAGQPLHMAFSGTASLVLQDDIGLLHRLSLGPVIANQGRQTMDAPLFVEVSDGNRALPAYPIQIVAIEFTSRFPFDTSRNVTVDIIDVLVADSSGRWEPLEFDHSPDAWAVEAVAIGQPHHLPQITEVEDQPRDALRVSIGTGAGFSGIAAYSIGPPWPSQSTYPVVVPADWLEESGGETGDEMSLPALSTGRSRAVIAGAITAFPTTGSPGGSDFVLMDLPTYQTMRYAPGNPIIEVDENWLSASGDSGSVADILQGPPFEATNVMSRSDRFLALSTDPVALATIGALTLGFLAAAVFAAVGFAVSATVSARERITEFALLRALGLSPRLLGAWMTLEQGALVVSSLGFGTLVGWLLTRTILPLITATQAGTRPVPDVAIVYPWDAVLTLEASLVAVLAVIVVAMTLLLRRLGLGSLLRLGDE
jgi:hypothetical protein